jgi:hypothetical protein
MMGEVDNEVVVGVIHNLLSIVFFIAIFNAGFPSGVFMKEGLYCPPFMNMLKMVGNCFCFPTRRWRIDSGVTLGTGVRCCGVVRGGGCWFVVGGGRWGWFDGWR